ncbi:MAG: vWA domain-containing protein [Candidatus Kapaibacteriales bacterium]
MKWHFSNPEYLLLLLLLVPIVFWYYFRRNKQFVSIKFSNVEGLKFAGRSLRTKLVDFPFWLRIVALALVIVALARPQSSSRHVQIQTEGIDIIIALDISGSMLAEDFKPNRLEAAKKITEQFVDARVNDRIGLVIFSARSFTQCPLTIDHAVFKNLLKQIKSGLIEDGTAIGMGLATAVDRLRFSKAKSKVIILLTDGVNNMGSIAPLTAAELAKTLGIKVYSIGVGTRGKAPYPMQTPFGIQYVNMDVEIDEPLLKGISETTGGKYFRATNNKSLEEIYSEIDKMEKTRIDESVYTNFYDEFFLFVFPAGIILIIEFLLRYLYLRKLP